MKKVFFLAVALMSVILFSCGDGSTRTVGPRVFNDTAIKTFQAANKTLEEFDAKITEAVKTNNLSGLEAEADAASADIDEKIEKMQALNGPETAQDYKNAVLKSLESVKEVIATGKKYASLPEGYSKKDFNALEKEYNEKRKELSNNLKEVATAQAAFAKTVN
ncbi:MAG: hypothetical protein LUG18_09270 [Candidatus Azobacteroides sp.]|nr:hypothetical protein [Candidatus Azobacteroides sp.]